MPEYIISRCPICNKPLYEKLDTYTVRQWFISPGKGTQGTQLFKEGEYCEHFLRIQPFINFKGIKPEISKAELDRDREFPSEVPHVQPAMLQSSAGCRAVIHSLPICRIENNTFVPAYSLYIVAYFAPPENHSQILNAQRQWVSGRTKVNCFFHWPKEGEKDEKLFWDLGYWTEQGSLSWLKPGDPDGALESDPAVFPYKDCKGRKYPYFIEEPSGTKISYSY